MSTASGNDESNQDRRPHLVMAVGNLVVGDSRVEKAAITARDLGYKVTVVGIRRRTVQQVSFIDGDIPVIRPPVGNEHHLRVADTIARREVLLEKRRRQINRLPQRLKRPAYIAHRIGVRSRDAGVRASAKLGRSWRTLWPHLVDYEATFFDAFRALEPDVIHVHDRHPLPGAAKYSRWAVRTPGVRPVKWLYDAHEFVPTQHLPPPVEHQQAWIAVERECIQHADAVVTVTDKIADLIRQRHRLDTRPAVVRNLPSLRQADQNDLRTDVRSELGLAPNVPIAVYAGGITPQRGLGTLLDAQPMVPELHVAIICKNDVDRRNALRAQARTLGTEERVHFLDYVPASHVSRFISTADVGISALLPSPAHEEAAPTKVSEYLHAYLPVVVSDMRAQAERVQRLGFGAVYRSGDATAMAHVIQDVLTHASEYKARITKEIILENSWEADLPNLTAEWGKLTPSDKHLQPPDVNDKYIVILGEPSGPICQWQRAISAIQRVKETRQRLPLLAGINGDLTDGKFMLTNDGIRFLEFWREEVSKVSGVLYDEDITLVEGWDPALTTGILSMSGKPAIRMIDGEYLGDVNKLKERFPTHWAHDTAIDKLDRIRERYSKLKNSIKSVDREVMTSNPALSWSLGKVAAFVPSPAPLINEHKSKSREGVNIGWIKSALRSNAELEALGNLNDATCTGARFIDLEAGPESGAYEEIDIFIDSLSGGFLTTNGIQALAAGCVVVTGDEPLAVASNTELVHSEEFEQLSPVIRTTIDSIMQTVMDLVQNHDRLVDAQKTSIDFSRRYLSPESIVDQILTAMRV